MQFAFGVHAAKFCLTPGRGGLFLSPHAGVTQLVECNLAKVDVASSSLVTRSSFSWFIITILLGTPRPLLKEDAKR